LPLVVVLVFALAGCGGTGSGGAGSPAENRPFPELEEAASGTTVNFFMYGGDDATNSYVDEWVAPSASSG
jgi:putative spermidine/putrescine transport system substrate-binding protein